MKKEISTSRIELQDSKHYVELYDFLTTGEVRKLQRTMFESKIPLTQDAAIAIDSERASAIFNMQDLALTFLLAKVCKKETNEEELIADAIEWVGSLSPKDGNLIYNRVTTIMNASMMQDDAKKN